MLFLSIDAATMATATLNNISGNGVTAGGIAGSGHSICHSGAMSDGEFFFLLSSRSVVRVIIIMAYTV